MVALVDGFLALMLYSQAPAAATPADAATPTASAEKTIEAAPPSAQPPPSKWAGSVGFGLISLTGNATALTVNATGLAELKTSDWIYGLKVSGIYGRSKAASDDPNADSQVLALAGSLQLRVDRRITQTVSAYLLGGAEADHVKSVEFRGIAEAGAGLIWIDLKEGDLAKALLRTDLAFRYANESRFQYFPTPMSLPGATLYAPKLGLAARYAFSKEVGLLEDAEILPSVSGDGRVIFNNLFKLTARVVRSLSLAVGFTVNFDSAPAPRKKHTDTALSVGLEYQL
jgi:putative salt-induced outer membrane protein YdiY